LVSHTGTWYEPWVPLAKGMNQLAYAGSVTCRHNNHDAPAWPARRRPTTPPFAPHPTATHLLPHRRVPRQRLDAAHTRTRTGVHACTNAPLAAVGGRRRAARQQQRPACSPVAVHPHRGAGRRRRCHLHLLHQQLLAVHGLPLGPQLLRVGPACRATHAVQAHTAALRPPAAGCPTHQSKSMMDLRRSRTTREVGGARNTGPGPPARPPPPPPPRPRSTRSARSGSTLTSSWSG
jgi:hypothetical protein